MDERDFPTQAPPINDGTEPCKPYIPPRQEALQQYEINIQFLSRGCIVKVGCKSIAFENVTEAIKELNKYVANPYEVQEKWRKELGN